MVSSLFLVRARSAESFDLFFCRELGFHVMWMLFFDAVLVFAGGASLALHFQTQLAVIVNR